MGSFQRELGERAALSQLCYTSCLGWKDPNVSHIYQIPIYCSSWTGQHKSSVSFSSCKWSYKWTIRRCLWEVFAFSQCTDHFWWANEIKQYYWEVAWINRPTMVGNRLRYRMAGFLGPQMNPLDRRWACAPPNIILCSAKWLTRG